MKCHGELEVAAVNLGSARSHKSAVWLPSVGIQRFELVARRHVGYAIAKQVQMKQNHDRW